MAMDINTYVAKTHLSPLIDQVNAARFASPQPMSHLELEMSHLRQ
jgi:hypothetical protein